MNIIVCVKQVIDPEAPPGIFNIDKASNTAVMKGVPEVIDPYSEYAVEAALRIKEEQGGKVKALSLGFNQTLNIINKSLAMGADELILLEDGAFEGDGADSWSTAYGLSAAINKIGEFDLILCGREASDTNAGQVGLGIAEILGLPSVNLAKKIEISHDTAQVGRVTADGHEVVGVDLPAVITVSNELGEPRYTTIKGIMAAKRMKPVIWSLADIGVETSQISNAGKRPAIQKLFKPVRERECIFISGENPREAGANLGVEMHKAKLL